MKTLRAICVLWMVLFVSSAPLTSEVLASQPLVEGDLEGDEIPYFFALMVFYDWTYHAFELGGAAAASMRRDLGIADVPEASALLREFASRAQENRRDRTAGLQAITDPEERAQFQAARTRRDLEFFRSLHTEFLQRWHSIGLDRCSIDSYIRHEVRPSMAVSIGESGVTQELWHELQSLDTFQCANSAQNPAGS